MKNPMVALARAAVLTAAAAAAVDGVEPSADTADPCLWLEERSDEASLEWVRSHVGATMDELRADSDQGGLTLTRMARAVD